MFPIRDEDFALPCSPLGTGYQVHSISTWFQWTTAPWSCASTAPMADVQLEVYGPVPEQRDTPKFGSFLKWRISKSPWLFQYVSIQKTEKSMTWMMTGGTPIPETSMSWYNWIYPREMELSRVTWWIELHQSWGWPSHRSLFASQRCNMCWASGTDSCALACIMYMAIP